VSEACSLNIDKVAQLARLYAAGTPPEQEFRAIKEWANAASNDELLGKDNSSHLARERGGYPRTFGSTIRIPQGMHSANEPK
jgi:hypothetical protein